MPEAAPSWRAWVWPPALATLAIALQLLVDVPHHSMEADDPDPPAQEHKANKPKPAAAPKPKPWKPRGAAYVNRLRKKWSKRAIADEPIDKRFAERHEELLQAVARKAEVAVDLSREPTAIVHARCHSVRCEFEVCALADAEALFETIAKVHAGKRLLWHELREVDGERDEDEGQTCREWIVDFAVEGPDPRTLQVREPKSTPAPAPAPSDEPTADE